MNVYLRSYYITCAVTYFILFTSVAIYNYKTGTTKDSYKLKRDLIDHVFGSLLLPIAGPIILIFGAMIVVGETMIKQ